MKLTTFRKLTMGRVTAYGKFEADVGCEMFKKGERFATNYIYSK